MNESCSVFCFSKDSDIYIYGAATVGGILYRKLSDLGFHIKGFIDKRADEITSFCKLPVFSANDEINNKENVVVVLAVKNVFEHSRISMQLKHAGFRYIVYRPYKALDVCNDSIECILNRCYDIIAGSEIRSIDSINIPIIDDDITIGTKLSGIINMDDHVVLYTPITMIFTDRKNKAPEFSIMYLKPHINFIRYVLGRDGGEIESYMEYCESAAYKINEDITITDNWRRNVLRNRSEVIANMVHRLNVDNHFFVKNAADAIWNEKKRYFNLNSGKHRTLLLFSYGYNYIPLRISREDYDSYMNYLDVDAIRDEYSRKYFTGMCPITENPFFLSESWINENFWFGVLREVMKAIREYSYVDSQTDSLLGRKVLLQLDESFFMERFFERLGMIVTKINDGSEFYLSIIEGEKYPIITTKVENSFIVSGEDYICEYNRISGWLYYGKTINLFGRRA